MECNFCQYILIEKGNNANKSHLLAAQPLQHGVVSSQYACMHACNAVHAHYWRHSIMPVPLTLHYMINVSRLKSNGCTKTCGLNKGRVSGMLKVGNGMLKAGANLVLIHSHLMSGVQERKEAVLFPPSSSTPSEQNTHTHSWLSQLTQLTQLGLVASWLNAP